MQPRFSDVLESVEELPMKDKEELIRIVQNRMKQTRQNQLLKEIEEAEREFEQGLGKEASVDEIMDEILS